MKILGNSNLNKQNFGNLYYTNTIVRKIGNPKFNKELAKIRNVISENKFDRKRFVDLYLGHDEGKGFYGIISSKKQGIPNNPYSREFISLNKSSIKEFREWLKQWNFDYSPRGLKHWKKLKEDALEILKK